MSSHPVTPRPSPRLRPRALVGTVWVLATVAVLLVGWLVLALSERGADRTSGALLLLAGGLAGLATVHLITGAGPRWLPSVAAAALVAAGVVAAVVTLGHERVFLADLLLAGGVPVLAGVSGWLLARRPAG